MLVVAVLRWWGRFIFVVNVGLLMGWRWRRVRFFLRRRRAMFFVRWIILMPIFLPRWRRINLRIVVVAAWRRTKGTRVGTFAAWVVFTRGDGRWLRLVVVIPSSNQSKRRHNPNKESYPLHVDD